jgi:hypothetical protein
MPLKRCKKDGKSGWKWGDGGACYTGKNGKKLAIKQGIAIEGPDKFKKVMEADRKKKAKAADADIEAATDEEVAEALGEYLDEEGSYTDGIIAGVEAALKFEADHDRAFASMSQQERDKVPRQDFAWPEAKKFPITDQAHLDAAVRLLGRAPKGKQAAIKRRIISIARRKGLKLPDAWKAD